MQGYMIRKGSIEDLKALHALDKTCFGRRSFSKDHVAWILRNPNAVTYIWEGNEGVAGSLMVHLEKGTARILSIGVYPRFRRRGIGKELMLLAEKEMVRRGAQEMRLEVSVNNHGAIRFYELLGYAITGILRNYYSWGDDAYVMTKKLAVENF